MSPCSPENPTGTCAAADDACVDGACIAVCTPADPTGYCPEGSSCTGGRCVSEAGCPSWTCSGPTCSAIISVPTPIRDRPGTSPIGLLDLSQADGRTPGANTGYLRHPDGTHTGGDMDLAYFVTDGSNDGDIICGDGTDTNEDGTPGRFNDGYFCTTEDNIVDWPRQAYWQTMLATSPLVRVIGVEETIVDDFRTEMARQLTTGWITRARHDRALRLGCSSEGDWALHHHHTHASVSRP